MPTVSPMFHCVFVWRDCVTTSNLLEHDWCFRSSRFFGTFVDDLEACIKLTWSVEFTWIPHWLDVDLFSISFHIFLLICSFLLSNQPSNWCFLLTYLGFVLREKIFYSRVSSIRFHADSQLSFIKCIRFTLSNQSKRSVRSCYKKV